MRILKANIDRFGKWTDTTFHFSEHMLDCFYGENESGKSTLQQFILYMLFGLPPKKRKRFIPKKQNGIGGSLTVFDEQEGVITIQRIDGELTCFMDNGDRQDETWWKKQLKGISKEVYTAVNAFSATDLEAIRTMDHADVSDILFSIGLNGSTAIYEVEKQLEGQLDELYKRRGKNPIMNQQINKVVETSESLHRVQNSEAEYAPLVHDKEEEEARVQAYQERLLVLKKELLITDKTIQSLPQIQTFQRDQQKLADYPSFLSFPSEGVERYQQLKERLLPLTSEHQLLKERKQEYEMRIEQLKKDMWTSETLELAKSILDVRTDYQHREKAIEQRKATLAHEEEEVNQLIHELQWHRDETKGTVLPFYLESTWQQLADDEHTLKQEQSTLSEKQHLLEEKRFSLLGDEENIRGQLLPEQERQQIEEQLAKDQFQKDNQKQKKDYEEWKNRQEERLKKLLYLYGFTIVISIVVGFMLDNFLFYGLALFVAIGAGVQYFYTGSHAKTIERMFFSNETAGKKLGTEERRRFERRLEQEQDLNLQLQAISQELRQNNLIQIQKEEQQQIMNQRTDQHDDRIESERFTYPFLQDVEVNYWPELLRLIRTLQKKNQSLNSTEKSIRMEEADNKVIDGQLQAFPYADHFSELEELLEQQGEIQSTLKQYEREVESITSSILETSKHLETLQMDRDKLFQEADADSEEAFYQRGNDLSAKEALLKEMTDIKEQLYHLFSSEQVEELLDFHIDAIELESRKEELELEIKETEETISNVHHHLGELQTKIRQLEVSKDSSELSLSYEMEKNLLNEQAEDWVVLKLVQTALEKAKKAYQEKHFSKVMTLTSRFFRELTSEQYRKVFPPKGAGLFQVEGHENIRYTVEELSQGTIDQLYVSLRFAIAKAMQDEFDLPLLIDDAFVHFDKTRTEKTIHLMESLSQEQQVIFFTCKEDVAKQFNHVYPMRETDEIMN